MTNDNAKSKLIAINCDRRLNKKFFNMLFITIIDRFVHPSNSDEKEELFYKYTPDKMDGCQ